MIDPVASYYTLSLSEESSISVSDIYNDTCNSATFGFCSLMFEISIQVVCGMVDWFYSVVWFNLGCC